jgi:U3 small nucleolar RNA-associated protein 7
VTDKKIRGMIERADQKYAQAASEAARAEILLPAEQGALVAEGMSRTYKFTQEAIADEVDVQTRRKIFDLTLDQFGPYMMDYSRSGRHLLLAGNKGHIAMLNAHTFRLQTEFHLKETVRDVKFLHNSNMFAVAQKQHAFIYDAMGVELHCLRNHVEPTRLEFLPHHFLLVSASKTGFFKYTDVSTGKLVVELRSKLGPCNTLAQNPRNAIICGGHGNGQVTMWSPNMTTPLVKMQCHRGPVSAIAVDPMGQYMCTAGMDSQVKVWDLRTYRVLQEYYTARPANSLDISQMGLLAAGFGPHVQVWKDAFTTKQQSPYLVHHVYGHEIADVQFCPYEDVLGLSHSEGFGSIVVPGAGEANFDSFATDIFASKKQRQEMEVRQLLDKLQPEMITMDTNVIGSVDRASKVNS